MKSISPGTSRAFVKLTNPVEVEKCMGKIKEVTLRQPEPPPLNLLSVVPDETKFYLARCGNNFTCLAVNSSNGGCDGWTFQSLTGTAYAILPKKSLSALLQCMLDEKTCCLEARIFEFDHLGEALDFAYGKN